MKNVSIYGKKWLDLVFEGKNKEYGAYQLRQENEKTSALALVFGITFLAGFVFLLSSIKLGITSISFFILNNFNVSSFKL